MTGPLNNNMAFGIILFVVSFPAMAWFFNWIGW